jgi:mannose-6-phosphate isomerase-like protein (cupin superfamily)
MKKLNPSLYKNKVENPKETVYEIMTAEDGYSWGLAIADIIESELHIHYKITEIYVVLEGVLEVTLDGNPQKLTVGESVNISPGVKHKARSLTGEPARIIALSFPEWTSEDHHLLK